MILGRADGGTYNTEAFKNAVAAVNAAGGGTLEVPAGIFFTGRSASAAESICTSTPVRSSGFREGADYPPAAVRASSA